MTKGGIVFDRGEVNISGPTSVSGVCQRSPARLSSPGLFVYLFLYAISVCYRKEISLLLLSVLCSLQTFWN